MEPQPLPSLPPPAVVAQPQLLLADVQEHQERKDVEPVEPVEPSPPRKVSRFKAMRNEEKDEKGQLGAGDGVGYDLHFLSRLYDIMLFLQICV